MQRFWKKAGIVPEAGGFALALDGAVWRTPAGRACCVPSRALAEALAGEWEQAGDPFDPRQALPLTQLAATALDIVGPKRDGVLAELAGYAAGDLLCFRAMEPARLAVLQQEIWQPYLEWVRERHGARLAVTAALRAAAQEPAALAALRAAAEAMDDYSLTVLQQVCAVTGSFVLALALVAGWRDAAAVFRAAELDALFQIEQWGADAEAQARLDSLEAELGVAARFLALCRAG